MTEDVQFLVMTVGLLFWTLSATFRIWRISRRLEEAEKLLTLHTQTHQLTHKLAQMHEDDVTKLFAHVGLSRADVPKIGPYR